MTGSRVAALVTVALAIVVGTVGGHYWHVTHPAQVAALVDRPVPSTAPPAAGSGPGIATRDPAPAIGTLPQVAAPQVAAPKSPAPDGKSPSFDVVRVEPQGDAVVAGKGAPNAKVALLSGGKVVGEAQSDANGQFVILPQRLAPGDHALTLRQTPDGRPASESTQSVAVSVPQQGKGKDKSKVVVALAEPGKATKLLSPPPGAAAGAAATMPAGKVAIRSAELENGSGIYVSGAAPAGTSVHVYLNNSHIADVVAGADGGWSVRVKHGLTGGHYSVRADAGGTNGSIASRAEVPFDVPNVMADAGKSPVAVGSASPGAPAAPTDGAAKPQAPDTASSPAGTAASNAAAAAAASPAVAAAGAPAPGTPASKDAAADATIESVATAHVTRGDNLWNISRFRLGDGLRYTQIYAANAQQIRDPNLIYPGQVFVVPQR